MGTYRKPASLVDTQSGKISRATTDRLSANFNKILQASLKQSEKRAKQKEESDKAIRKIYTEEASRLAIGNSNIKNSTINAQSITNTTRSISEQTAAARIRLLAGGAVPGTEEFNRLATKAAIGVQFFDNMPTRLAALEASDSQITTDISKGVGSKPGMISAASVKDSRFLEAYSPGTGWETGYGAEVGEDGEYHDYLQREKDGVIIKDYANFLGGESPETKFNRQSYRINPDVIGGTQEILKGINVLKDNNTPADMFIKESTEDVAGSIYNIESIDSDKLYSSVDPAATEYGELIIKNGVESMLDLLQEEGIGEKIPGSDAVGYRFFKRNKDGSIYKNAEGKAEREDKATPITNQFGQFIMDPENNSPDAAFLSDDEYDGFMRMVHEISANGAGAFSDPRRELDGAATERLRKSRADAAKGAKLTDKQEIQNFNLIEINKYKERQLDELPWGQKFKADEVDVNKANTLLAETLNGLSYVGDLTGTLEVKYVEKPTGIGGKGPLDGFIEVYRISNTRRTKEDEFKLSDGGQMESFDQYLNKNLYGKVGLTNKTNAY